jgi:hypothetical protein
VQELKNTTLRPKFEKTQKMLIYISSHGMCFSPEGERTCDYRGTNKKSVFGMGDKQQWKAETLYGRIPKNLDYLLIVLDFCFSGTFAKEFLDELETQQKKLDNEHEDKIKGIIYIISSTTIESSYDQTSEVIWKTMIDCGPLINFDKMITQNLLRILETSDNIGKAYQISTERISEILINNPSFINLYDNTNVDKKDKIMNLLSPKLFVYPLMKFGNSNFDNAKNILIPNISEFYTTKSGITTTWKISEKNKPFEDDKMRSSIIRNKFLDISETFEADSFETSMKKYFIDYAFHTKEKVNFVDNPKKQLRFFYYHYIPLIKLTKLGQVGSRNYTNLAYDLIRELIIQWQDIIDFYGQKVFDYLM